MKCPKCGAEMPQVASFCGVCGGKLDPAYVANQLHQTEQEAAAVAANDHKRREVGVIKVMDCFRQAWESFKTSPGVVMALFVGWAFILAFGSALIRAIFGSSPVEEGFNINFFHVGHFMEGLWQLFQNVFTAGFLYGALKLHRGEQAVFTDLFILFKKENLGRIGHLLLAALLWTLAIVLGLILLVIPGIILFLGLSQWLVILMDSDKNSVESLRESWRIMRGRKTQFLGFLLLVLLLNLLGLCALGFGLLLTVPVSVLAMVAYYDAVKRAADEPNLP